MSEREDAARQLQIELGKVDAFERLSHSGDFKVFRDSIEKKLEEYRNLLEVAEDDKLSTVRGGIIALREIIAYFDDSIRRRGEIQSRLKELGI